MYLTLARLGGPTELYTLLERLGGMSLFCLMLSIGFYILSSLLLTRSARYENRDRPGILFFTACALQFGLLGLLIFLMACCHPYIIVLVVVSLLVAAVYSCLPPLDPSNHRPFRREGPRPKLQFYTMDLCIGVLYYGLLLSLYLLAQDAMLRASAEFTSWIDSDTPPTVWQLWSSGLDNHQQLVPSHILTLEVSLFLVVGVSLLAALDVLRLTAAPLGCAKRSLALLGILSYFTITFIGGGLAAWAAWRTALSAVEQEEWKEGLRKKDGVAVEPVAACSNGSGSG